MLGGRPHRGAKVKMMKKNCLFVFFLLFSFILFSESPDTFIPKEQKTINDYYILGNEDDVIYSIGDGIVDIGFDSNKGNYIIADYKSLGIKVTYCNLGNMYVRRNQIIKKGDKLAKIGMTGYTDKIGCSIIIEIDQDTFLYRKDNSQ